MVSNVYNKVTLRIHQQHKNLKSWETCFLQIKKSLYIKGYIMPKKIIQKLMFNEGNVLENQRFSDVFQGV